MLLYTTVIQLVNILVCEQLFGISYLKPIALFIVYIVWPIVCVPIYIISDRYPYYGGCGGQSYPSYPTLNKEVAAGMHLVLLVVLADLNIMHQKEEMVVVRGDIHLECEFEVEEMPKGGKSP
jgi:hypothetical protein